MIHATAGWVKCDERGCKQSYFYVSVSGRVRLNDAPPQAGLADTRQQVPVSRP